MLETLKQIGKLCEVEILAALAFLVTAVICLCAGEYEGAIVLSVAAVLAGLIGLWRYRNLGNPQENPFVLIANTPELDATTRRALTSKRKPSEPKRKPVKTPKKKTTKRK
jgi:hypothetical protein